MKKIIYGFVILLLFCNCRNLLFNAALKSMGAYDDKITLRRFTAESKELVVFPIIHIATEAQYDDVKKKVDSLSSLGYYFYFENVAVSYSDTTIVLRKFRKIAKMPIPTKGYMYVIDSVMGKKFDIKLKKKIVNQPPFNKLGLDSLNARNVDVKMSDLVDFYESKYKPIILEPCDLNTSIYEESGCKDHREYPEMTQEILIDFRNNHVLKELIREKRSKIAIIYGKDHYKGLKEGLIKMGYTNR